MVYKSTYTGALKVQRTFDVWLVVDFKALNFGFSNWFVEC
jgi:hypothetical protein